jgi:hypothetical protein
MAIQQVGGQGVYVITGSGRDPRKTTSGQSWADLVTQQKYMLIKEAQREALRQMEQEQLSFQDRQRRQEQLRQNLQSQIQAERKAIEDLRIKQITVNEAREVENQRIKARSPEYKPSRAPGSGTSETRTIPTEEQYLKDLQSITDRALRTQQLARADRQKLVEAQKKGQTLAEVAPDLLSGTQISDLQTIQQVIDRLKKNIEQSQSTQKLAQDKLDAYDAAAPTARPALLEKAAKRTIRTGSGAGGGAVTPAAKTLEDLPKFTGFDPEIERRQERMRKLQAEMDALEFEERPTFNGIDEMRRVYGESFPEQPRQRLRDRFRREPQPAPAAQPMVEESFTEPQEATQAFENLDAMQQYGVRDEPMMVGGADTQPIMQQQPAPAQPAPRQEEMEALGMDFEFQPSTVENVTEETFTDDIAQPIMQPARSAQFMEALPSDFGPAQFGGFRPETMPTPYQGERFVEQMILGLEPEAPQVGYAAQFEDVKFGTAAQKQRRALELIIDASKEMGPTSPEYNKAKVQILTELQKTMDPKEYRKQKKVERVMDKNPKDYMALAKTVRGLSDKDAQLVMSLFPVSSDMKIEEIDKLYKSAQKELTTNLTGRNRKKALEFLELQYIAVMDDYNNFGK